jgi:large subunit ribosomal protein L18
VPTKVVALRPLRYKGKAKSARAKRVIRHIRVRRKVYGAPERPRMAVFRSSNHIFVQIIDDQAQHTVAAASDMDPEIRSECEGKRKTEVAKLVGTLAASRGKAAGVTKVVFDRGGYAYHGRVQALAEAAREGGLTF